MIDVNRLREFEIERDKIDDQIDFIATRWHRAITDYAIRGMMERWDIGECEVIVEYLDSWQGGNDQTFVRVPVSALADEPSFDRAVEAEKSRRAREKINDEKKKERAAKAKRLAEFKKLKAEFGK